MFAATVNNIKLTQVIVLLQRLVIFLNKFKLGA